MKSSCTTPWCFWIRGNFISGCICKHLAKGGQNTAQNAQNVKPQPKRPTHTRPRIHTRKRFTSVAFRCSSSPSCRPRHPPSSRPARHKSIPSKNDLKKKKKRSPHEKPQMFWACENLEEEGVSRTGSPSYTAFRSGAGSSQLTCCSWF